MHQITIDELFEHRIAMILKDLFKELEINPQTQDADELMNIIESNPHELGQLLAQDIFTWMSNDEWKAKVTV